MQLKGVNLGGWLLMEGYTLGGRNIAESEFKKSFLKAYGSKELVRFESLFRENFITEDDFERISLTGANVIRLPFNHRLIEKSSRKSQAGILYLKKALKFAEKYNIGIILDLHAAAGSQNCDWHSDSRGKALFWEKPELRKRTTALWEYIVSALKDEPALIGYDVINEPVLSADKRKVLRGFYADTIKSIKSIDKKHIIFLEGDVWAQQIDFLKDIIATNVSLSIHTYQPLNYVFNFRPFYSFPGIIDSGFWGKDQIKKHLEPYCIFSKKNNVKIFVGEFGINWRGGFWGELNWLKSMLETFEMFDFDYTYWTYKAVSGYLFPDGLYQYIPDSKYVCRQGPVYGWENYLKYWKNESQDISDFWRTKNFTKNEKIVSCLTDFFKKGKQ